MYKTEFKNSILNKIREIIKPSQEIKERIVFKEVPKRFPTKKPKNNEKSAFEKKDLKKKSLICKSLVIVLRKEMREVKIFIPVFMDDFRF